MNRSSGSIISVSSRNRRRRAATRRLQAPAPAKSTPKPEPPTWHTPAGEPVSCVEKIKVLNENLAELRTMAQEALEDAVLMGADEEQFRQYLKIISESIVNPYKK